MQEIVAASQVVDFTLQFLQTLAFIRREAATTGIPFMLAEPDTQGLWHTAYFRGNGAEGCPV